MWIIRVICLVLTMNSVLSEHYYNLLSLCSSSSSIVGCNRLETGERELTLYDSLYSFSMRLIICFFIEVAFKFNGWGRVDSCLCECVPVVCSSICQKLLSRTEFAYFSSVTLIMTPQHVMKDWFCHQLNFFNTWGKNNLHLSRFDLMCWSVIQNCD